MTVAAKEETRKKTPRKEGDQIKVQGDKKRKVKPQLLSKSKDKGVKGLKKKIVDKAISQKNKVHKKIPSSGGVKDKLAKSSEKSADKDVEPHNCKKKRRKKIKNKSEIDEASRLQRRTRYLLIKMKLEQNFIDAYSAEGWKGQSREKLKPAQELQRARKQILNCKLGIREAIRQLDLLSSVGRINVSAVDPDGSVHHEHIICAKCKSREAQRDNDIILCDGTCNCAYHQKCLDPPLLTEDIPPKDEGWLCKFCTKKMEILEATNAHIGTQFPVDSTWEDVFKEEADLPDGENSILCTEEWPSDDSEDGDYDPVEPSYSDHISFSDSDASKCSSSFLGSLEDEPLLGIGRSRGSSNNSLQIIGVDSDDINAEVLSHPRQRASVDYIKLHDEMFGISAVDIEQITDDEDWGPTKRRRKQKGTDVSSNPRTTDETEIISQQENMPEETSLETKEKTSSRKKRPIFRLPHSAVERLRFAFAENELPARSLRKSLSEELGLDFGKVNKWFKNARYLALKARKARGDPSMDVGPSGQNESASESEKDEHADEMAFTDNKTSDPDKSYNKYVRRRNTKILPISPNKRQKKQLLVQIPGVIKTKVDPGDNVSLKHLKDKAKAAKKKLSRKNRRDTRDAAEAGMERLCQLKNRVERLREVLLQLPSSKHGKSKVNDPYTVYVPVAELREKW